MDKFLIEKYEKEIKEYEKVISMAQTSMKYDFAITLDDDIIYRADYVLRARLQDIIVSYIKYKMHETKKELRRFKKCSTNSSDNARQ